ncbi:MAG: molybdopterin-dependent oxidoreductase [Chloroflexi bacterium]|nr:molybdopterin-dependent oxidoreductase [Chloroflexota bacterium]
MREGLLHPPSYRHLAYKETMRHRWANTSLLLLVLAEVATGAFGLAAGASNRAFLNDLHAVFSFGIVAILGWKTALAIGSLKRPAGTRPRYLSLVLAALLLATLGLGFWWSNGVFADISGTSLLTIHIWLGLATAAIILYHAWAYTRRFRIGYSADRRSALRLMTALAAGAAAWGVSEGIGNALDTPASRRRFTGSHERASFKGNAFPTTSWLNDNPRFIDPNRWELTVTGEVSTPLVLSLAELREGGRFEVVEATETLDCTSGWYSTQVWTGVRVGDVLDAAGIEPDTRSVSFVSRTGFSRRMPYGDVRGYILATHVGGEPISHRHGAPLRLVAPGRRGFEWVKWLAAINANSSPSWLQWPFPIE